MSRANRLALVVVAALVAVAAFAVLRPDQPSDPDRPSRPEPQSANRAGEQGGADRPAGLEEGRTPADASRPGTSAGRPAPEPAGPQVRIEGGKPAGGVKEIALTKGETAGITVLSDTPHEVHLHGYDLTRQAAPGTPARFRFKANLEGIFEMELHGTQTQVAQVRVEP